VREAFNLNDNGWGDGTAVVSVSGDLDLWNSPALEQRLRSCVERGDAWIVVDLTKASFLDSSGLGALTASMRAVERKGGRLVVVNRSDQMRRVFELTGLLRVLNVMPSVDRARAFLAEVRSAPQP
jgi:anti-sigma B factor antagonist